MKKLLRSILACLLVVTLVSGNVVISHAHSGRTDSSGGHKDNKNKSGLGSYHYHCGGYPAHLHEGGYCPYTDVFPRGVSITVEKSTLRLGESTTFSAEVYPFNACDTYVSLSCDDSDVIRISGNTITAVGYGTATIHAESFNGKTKTVKLVVKEITADRVTVITSMEDDETVYIGDTFTCTATITPADVDNPAIEWASSDTNIATVDKNGNVKTLAEGEVIISATASNNVVGKKTIHVKEKYVENVEISEERMEIILMEKHTLSAVVTPADATFPEITWSSSDPSVVEIDEKGNIVASSCGTAIITATATNGVADSVEITVKEIIAERIEITGTSTIFLNEEGSFKAQIYPVDTTIQDITWCISDSSIATIDEEGTVRGLAPGSVNITVTQKDVSASVPLEVRIRQVERIGIESSLPKGKKLHVGDTMHLAATVYPENATYKDITWSSSDETIATVDEEGNVTALARGKVVVTASTQDGQTKEYEISMSHTFGSLLKWIFGKKV